MTSQESPSGLEEELPAPSPHFAHWQWGRGEVGTESGFGQQEIR